MTLKKIVIKVFTVCLCVILAATSFAGCKLKENNTPEDKSPEDFSGFYYYPQMRAAEKVYYVSGANVAVMNYNHQAVLVSLQGIVAQETAEIWIDSSPWIREILADKHGVVFEEFIPQGADTAWELAEKFKGSLNGYVLTDIGGGRSINTATVIAGMEKALIIDASEEAKAIALGLTKIDDAREYTEEEIFEKYKDSMNKSLLFHCGEKIAGADAPLILGIRDYAIATKSFCFFYDMFKDSLPFYYKVLGWADDNIPIMGWTETEADYVKNNSNFKKITMCGDWCGNFSVMSAYRTAENLVQVNNPRKEIEPEAGKHYLSLVMSDGDNLCWHTSNFWQGYDRWYGSPQRGDFKITWGINASANDIFSYIYDAEYKAATANDEFMAQAAGAGYINVSEYGSGKGSPEDLKVFAEQTNEYMKRTDTRVMNLLDDYPKLSALQEFAKQPQIMGGLWMLGYKYIQGQGAVYWENGKPFVTYRDALWRVAPQGLSPSEEYDYLNTPWTDTELNAVADRINTSKRDYKTIDGYTVMVIHAWTTTMDDVAKFVGRLDPAIELISSEQLLALVSKNVPQINAMPDKL